ncbi:hypothetical protein N7472_008077 [Penicillium cf. griseofulvum]|uniref:Uncharacterized protein n=1 Tax=Penicillium cf. griseofulvum TaxID=2972120 RepID=A0A9W9J324_9EURO|nr:hypothetical protein N7472_008077 [Penicillium cf. griseofulvum]KAJ5452624.1 hypothetical protein N7445_000807 [Penicillium cf. griseofulvum]
MCHSALAIQRLSRSRRNGLSEIMWGDLCTLSTIEAKINYIRSNPTGGDLRMNSSIGAVCAASPCPFAE